VHSNIDTDRGFTLLEVMIALAIIAITLGALISTSGSQASSAGYLKQKTLAHWVALNEITRLQAGN
jgi:general secretion pathway protein I